MSKKIDGIYVALRGDYRQLESDLKEAKRVVKDASVNMSDAMGNALAPEKLKRSLGTLVTDLSQLQRSSKVTAADFKSIGFAATDLGARLGLPEKQLAALQARMLNHQAAESQVQALKRIATQAGLTAREIRTLGASMGVSSAGIAAAGGGKDMFGSMTAGALAFVGPAGLSMAALYGVGRAAGSAGKAAFDAYVEYDRLSKAYTTITGSSQAARAQLNFLYEEADRLGMQFQESAKSAKIFFAAGKGTSIEGDLNRIYSSVSEAGTALSMTREEQGGVFLAMGQMMSKGKVQAEELRGQVGERLPGAFQLAAKAMGVTTAELDKILEEGKVLADDLLPRLGTVMHDQFGKAAIEAAKGGAQEVNRMSTEWELFKANVMDVDPVIAAIKGVTNALKGASVEMIQNEMRAKGIRPAGERSLNWGASVAAGIPVGERDYTQGQIDLYKKYGTADIGKATAIIMAQQVEKAKAAQEASLDKALSRAGASSKSFLSGAKDTRRQKIIDDADDALRDVQAAREKDAEHAERWDKKIVAIKAEKARKLKELDSSSVADVKKHAEEMRKLQDQEDAFIGKLGAEKDERGVAQKQAIYDAENEIKEQLAKDGYRIATEYDGRATASAKESLIAQYREAESYTKDKAGLAAELERKLTDIDLQRLQRTRTSMDGMKAALLDYSQAAGNDGANMFQLWTTSIKATEDALVEMGMKGEISITSLFNTIRAEALRTQVVRPLMAGLAGFDFAGMFSGIFHEGGIVGETASPMRMVSPSLFAGAPRFHNGLMPDEFPAILQKGEAVIPRNQVGGLGGGTSVEVSIHNYTGAPVKTQESTGPGGQRQLQIIVGDMVKGAFASGQMDRTMQQNYGLKRQGV